MATRFYIWEAGTAPISPAVGTGWAATLASFARRPMHTTARLGDALTTVAMTAPTVGTVQAYRQCISRPMAAGNVFTTSTTFKAYAQVLESAINDNLFARCNVRILSEDGTTVRATLKAVADYSAVTEFNTALRNKAFLDGDASAANYTTVDGDRLVFELGAADAAGASIAGSIRMGSTGSTIADLGENETSTSTTERPWFETSLTITFKTPTIVDRYINTASTSGGDGTTNGTAGATRAWNSIATAWAAGAMGATDWPTQNQILRVNCSGTAADAPASTTGVGITIHSSPDCYVLLIGDAASSLIYDATKYRIEPAKGAAPLLNQGCLYLRQSQLQAKANPPDGAGGYNAFNMAAITTPEPGDIRTDRMFLDSVINNANTGGEAGFANATAAPNIKWTITNSVAANFTGTGATHKGFLKSTGSTVDIAYENCLAYNCGIGFHSQTNDALAKNCNAQSCADGYSGTFAAASTNNASSIASDAPATNAQTGTTTFVSAGTDFHLSSSDTVCKDHGTDLSADSRLAFSTDGDGDTRTGTWDIGPDELAGVIAAAIAAAAAAAAFAATVTLGSLSSVSTVAAANAAGKAGSTVSLGAISPVSTVAPAAAAGTAGATVSVGAISPVSIVAPAVAAGRSGSTVSVGAVSPVSIVAPSSAAAPIATSSLGALSVIATVGAASGAALAATVSLAFLATGVVAPAGAVGLTATVSLGALSVTALAAAAAAAAVTGVASLGALSVIGIVSPAGAAALVGTVSVGALSVTAVRAPAAAAALVGVTDLGTLTVPAFVAPASAVGRTGTTSLGALTVTAVVSPALAASPFAAAALGAVTGVGIVAPATAAALAASLVTVIAVVATVAPASAVAPSATVDLSVAVLGTMAPAAALALASALSVGGLTIVALSAPALAAAFAGDATADSVTVSAVVAAALAAAPAAGLALDTLAVTAVAGAAAAAALAAAVPAEGTVNAVVANAVANAFIATTSLGPVIVFAAPATAFASAAIASILASEPPGRVLRAVVNIYPLLVAVPAMNPRLAADASALPLWSADPAAGPRLTADSDLRAVLDADLTIYRKNT